MEARKPEGILRNLISCPNKLQAMTNISSSPGSGISREELAEAIPDEFRTKQIHLHWVEKAPSGKGRYSLTAKLDINGNSLLLKSSTGDVQIIEDWNEKDPSYHTNARLVALERILTDPDNEEMLISL